jgi:TetR/AcrR family transcriptional regulator, tetracycline repressor protein
MMCLILLDISCSPYRNPCSLRRRYDQVVSPRPATKVGLTPDLIIGAALEIVDNDGLDALTLRNLGRRLDVNPNAITWHVGNRTQLLEKVADQVLRGVAVVGRTRSWERRLRIVATQFRSAMMAHPNAAPLIGTRLTSISTGSADIIEELLHTLHLAGLGGRAAIDTMNALIGAVTGFVVLELATPPDDDLQAWAADVRTALDELDPSRYPNVVAQRPLLENRSFVTRWTSGTSAPLTSSFTRLLDLLIASIRHETLTDAQAVSDER